MNGTNGMFIEDTEEKGVKKVNTPGGLSFRLNLDDKKTLDGASITKGLIRLEEVPENERTDNWEEACKTLDKAISILY